MMRMSATVYEFASPNFSPRLCLGGRTTILDRSQALDQFLAGVERRAFRMAQVATGDADEAMDLVRDTMLRLVQPVEEMIGRSATKVHSIPILLVQPNSWFTESSI